MSLNQPASGNYGKINVPNVTPVKIDAGSVQKHILKKQAENALASLNLLEKQQK